MTKSQTAPTSFRGLWSCVGHRLHPWGGLRPTGCPSSHQNWQTQGKMWEFHLNQRSDKTSKSAGTFRAIDSTLLPMYLALASKGWQLQLSASSTQGIICQHQIYVRKSFWNAQHSNVEHPVSKDLSRLWQTTQINLIILSLSSVTCWVFFFFLVNPSLPHPFYEVKLSTHRRAA